MNKDGDIVVLSEAEFNPKDKDNILGEFPNYDIHFKLIPRAIKARVMMMVKKDTVNITRLYNIEEPASSCMWFKIDTQAMSFVLATWYTQWEHPEIVK